MRTASLLQIVPLFLLSAACGSSHPPPVRASDLAVDSPVVPPPGGASTVLVQAAPYEVHEWGLIDVSANGLVEISAGPGQPARPMHVRKPVLYVHLLDGSPGLSFSAHVVLGSGSIVEHWPAGLVSGGVLDWPRVVARSEHCSIDGSIARSPQPPRRSAPIAQCASPDGVCEIAELPSYVAPSAACLSAGQASGPLLFYRGATNALTLPVKAARRPDMTAVVSATGSLAGAPGQVLRLSTGMSGPWPPGYVVVSRAPLPAEGGSVELAVGNMQVVGAQERATLASWVTSLGLTDDEAQALVRAWGDELFGPGGSARDQPAALLPRLQDVIVLALPPSCYDDVSRLTFVPSPRAVRRAFLLRIDLGPVSTA